MPLKSDFLSFENPWSTSQSAQVEACTISDAPGALAQLPVQHGELCELFVVPCIQFGMLPTVSTYGGLWDISLFERAVLFFMLNKYALFA